MLASGKKNEWKILSWCKRMKNVNKWGKKRMKNITKRKNEWKILLKEKKLIKLAWGKKNEKY